MAALLQAGRVGGDTEACLQDSFAMAGQGWPRPFEEGVENLKCRFRYTDAADLKYFTLIYYPSTPHFADFNGTDMVPERHHELSTKLHRLTQRWIPGRNGPPAQTQRIRLGECEIPANDEDGSTYSIQRVGPLVSSGNYDYWQFAWPDVWRLNDRLKKHKEIMFTSSFSGPVDKQNRILGHPPIHIHHIHISPAPGIVTKLMGKRCMTGQDPNQCYVANLAVEQHGDYQCTDQDGGLDCFFEKTAEGFAKVLSEPLDLEGEINDVRAPNSEPMTWWYQVVLRWFPKTTKYRVLSQHFLVGPGQFNPSDQRHNVMVFPVNTKKRSVYWYTGKMEYDGELLRNKLHSHNTMFDRAFFFRASPHDLGLDDIKFWPNKSWEPVLMEQLDFKDFEDLQATLLGNLRAAGQRYDDACPKGRRCGSGRPALTCQSWVANQDFVDPASGMTFAYDRRAPCCCRPWKFRVGDVFTVVAFMAPLKTPPGPWMPHMIPPKANMHIHWLMTYATDDNRSHYRQTVYTQNTDMQVVYPEDLSRYPLWTLLTGHTYGSEGFHNKFLTVRQKAYIACLWSMATMQSFAGELAGILLAAGLALAVCFAHGVLRFRVLRQMQRHPAVKCATETVPCQPEAVVRAAQVCCQDPELLNHDD